MTQLITYHFSYVNPFLEFLINIYDLPSGVRNPVSTQQNCIQTKDFAKKPGFFSQRVRPHSSLHCEEVEEIPRGWPSPLKENTSPLLQPDFFQPAKPLSKRKQFDCAAVPPTNFASQKPERSALNILPVAALQTKPKSVSKPNQQNGKASPEFPAAQSSFPPFYC